MDGDVFWGFVLVIVFYVLPVLCVVALVVGGLSAKFRPAALRVAGGSATVVVGYVVLVAALGGFE